jgi:uncharacterized protein
VQYNVAQLLKSPVGTSRSYELARDLDHIDDNPATRKLTGTVRLTRTKRGVLVDAILATSVRLQCSRCLEDVDFALPIRVQEEFLPAADVATGLPIALEDDELEAFRIGDDHVLDLEESVRQYGLLGLPLKPLCDPDCLGLCPTCGRNLNQGPCDCGEHLDDIGLMPLSSLLDQLKLKE